MLLTIKDLSAWLNIKPSTLYLWAAEGKIPCRKIHGLIRFEREAIERWLDSFGGKQSKPVPPILSRETRRKVPIASASGSVYTSACEKPDEDRAKQGG